MYASGQFSTVNSDNIASLLTDNNPNNGIFFKDNDCNLLDVICNVFKLHPVVGNKTFVSNVSFRLTSLNIANIDRSNTDDFPVDVSPNFVHPFSFIFEINLLFSFRRISFNTFAF